LNINAIARENNVHGTFTGKSAGCPSLWAGRAVTDSRSGVKADPVIVVTSPGSPCLACIVLTGWARSFPSGVQNSGFG
jgi:hypothetical protein